MRINPLFLTDSYKVSHHRQYPPGTEHVYSYFESRGGDFKETLFFGLQAILLTHFLEPITLGDVQEASEFYADHFGDKTIFNRTGWDRLVRKHGGTIPLRIKAVPEGTVVPVSNVLMTVENTDPEFPWLTNWYETLLAQIWYPTTVATLSRAMRLLILNYLERTGDPAGIDFKLHDFGFRGVSSVESAAMGGMAHLVNFKGTDTVAALWAARRYYGERMAGYSIPASEHSTITSWGGPDNEIDAFRNMIRRFGRGGSGLYAVVSDSYDIYRACRDLWGGALFQEVLDAPNTLVIRPDSGVPHQVVPDVIAILMSKFGYTTNAKGYNVLNPKMRVIQGDGIEYAETERILAHMEIVEQSADNVAFGMGGGLLQKVNRDTLKFAFKCSHVSGDTVLDDPAYRATGNGRWERDVFKEPVTDPGKNSKRGRLKLVRWREGTDIVRGRLYAAPRYLTVPASQPSGPDELVTVYENGELKIRWTLAEIRARAAGVERAEAAAA